MLPIYKAISFQKTLKGGRTKPWLVLAETNGKEIKPFVMKIFDTINLEARDHVTAEVIGYCLAKEFDFTIPSAAYLEIDENFLSTINDAEAYETLEKKDVRLKFATEFVDGSFLFDPQLPKSDALRLIDLETLYAFDNFIRNRDRNHRKPNLIVKQDEGFLIDHEMALEIDTECVEQFRNNIWDLRFQRYHISHSYSRHGANKNKRNYFSTFEEYLKTLNLNVLNGYLSQLNNLGYTTDRHGIILEYFNEIKTNSHKFVALLRSGIDG